MLGPVRLWRGTEPVALTNRKTQALLLVLTLDGAASRPRLCALLWPDLDEPSARRNLRRELARLREAGVPEAFRVNDDHLHRGDTLSCDLLKAEATPELALAPWQGELADGLQLDDAPQFAPWLSAARERALRLRFSALEAAAAAAEARADLAAALAHVQSLLDEDGLQERHHRQAMRLLAAAGQREAALRQFERCQAVLAAELGLQPMPETVALAQSLRGTSATTAVALPLPQRAWPERLPFVGRAAEVARLQGAWLRRTAVVIVGESGVGKTRLATDFAASQGAYALVRCRGGDRDIAFGACARVLRVLAGDPPDLRGLDDWIVAEVARLLPELGPAPEPLRTQAEQLRFDEACIQAWLALSRGSFDALVLDDWQLADPASRTLLARAAARRREAGAEGAIELVCWRGAADDAELPGFSAALAAETIALGPLPAEAVYELVRQLSGAADPARFAERLCSATGGHPYFISETLRDLAETAVLDVDEQGRWRTPFDAVTQDYRELPMPASVRDAVLARVRRLDAPTARLLEAAALAGEPFGAAWLASACALSELEVVQALEQAAQAQLVRAHAAGGYAWTHDLARQALDSALEPVRRRLVNHRLALGAEALGASAEAARHFEACGEARRAVAHRLAAGDAARALAALGEAARHWQVGLADDPTPPQAAALLARLLEAEHGLGRHAEAEACRQRLEDLRAGTALPPEAEVEAGHALARYLVRGKSAQAALAVLDTLPPPADDSQRLRRLSLRMDALQQHGRTTRRARWVRRRWPSSTRPTRSGRSCWPRWRCWSSRPRASMPPSSGPTCSLPQAGSAATACSSRAACNCAVPSRPSAATWASPRPTCARPPRWRGASATGRRSCSRSTTWPSPSCSRRAPPTHCRSSRKAGRCAPNSRAAKRGRCSARCLSTPISWWATGAAPGPTSSRPSPRLSPSASRCPSLASRWRCWSRWPCWASGRAPQRCWRRWTMTHWRSRRRPGSRSGWFAPWRRCCAATSTRREIGCSAWARRMRSRTRACGCGWRWWMPSAAAAKAIRPAPSRCWHPTTRRG